MTLLERIFMSEMDSADWECLAANFNSYEKVSEIVGCSTGYAKVKILAVGGFSE